MTTCTFGGGGPRQKRQRTSCDFHGGMIFFVLFCSPFEDILLTKSGNNNKKEQKKIKKIKIMIFFEDIFLAKFVTKTLILNVFRKRTKMNKKDKGHIGFFPAA